MIREPNINVSGDEARMLLKSMLDTYEIIQLFVKLQQLSAVQPPQEQEQQDGQAQHG